MSIPPFIGLCSPIIGKILSKFGRLPQFLLIGNLLSISSVLIFYFQPTCDEDCIGVVILAMVFLGFFFKLFCCVLYPAIAMLVKEKSVGVAYGVAFSSKNLVTLQILDSQTKGHSTCSFICRTHN